MPTQKPMPAAKPAAPATSQNVGKATTYPPIDNETNTIKTNIPTPAQVKGVILAPENKPKTVEAAGKTANSSEKSVTQSIKDKINNAVKKITE